jgi:hypothetical protein
MKKAFDANVSRMKPRVRLGALLATPENHEMNLAVEDIASRVARENLTPTLGEAVKAKAQSKNQPMTVSARVESALLRALQQAPVTTDEAEALEPSVTNVEAPHATPSVNAQKLRALVLESSPRPRPPTFEMKPKADPEPAVQFMVDEMQQTPVSTASGADAPERRERLKERLKAVRENPRPEPLPDTVAEAGVLAVGRIAALQTEVAKVRALNLALTQDLEAARRQAERATEEARSRMDEARRLSTEMAARVSLLSELESELESLEAERNEALVALQQSRQATELRETEKAALQKQFDAKVVEMNECLVEEERLADELEKQQETTTSLRRGLLALTTERDTLARQVSDLTQERSELLEARKALDAVHRALSSAVVR